MSALILIGDDIKQKKSKGLNTKVSMSERMRVTVILIYGNYATVKRGNLKSRGNLINVCIMTHLIVLTSIH